MTQQQDLIGQLLLSLSNRLRRIGHCHNFKLVVCELRPDELYRYTIIAEFWKFGWFSDIPNMFIRDRILLAFAALEEQIKDSNTLINLYCSEEKSMALTFEKCRYSYVGGAVVEMGLATSRRPFDKFVATLRFTIKGGKPLVPLKPDQRGQMVMEYSLHNLDLTFYERE